MTKYTMRMLKTIILLALMAGTPFCSTPIQVDTPEVKDDEETETGGETDPDDDTAQLPEGSEYLSCDLVGVDHFGRAFSTICGFKDNRQVGIFYWPWIGQPYASGIYDATKIAALPNGINILTSFDHLDPSISPNWQAHYWGEPLWGYYNSEDEWVIRKQMEMLTWAGIDFIYFDITNAVIYENVLKKVSAVLHGMIKEGWKAPRVVYYTHSKSIETIKALYAAIYKPQVFPDTWYRVDGKPMIIGYTDPQDDIREARSRGDTSYNPGELPAEIRNFFHFFKAQWPFDPVYEDGFPWVEWSFPQPYHSASQVMNVTVASHPAVPMSFSLTRPGWINWGRGWSVTLKKNIEADVDKGTYFQAQWEQVFIKDPAMVSVGGWNEWIAYKQPYDGEYMLCDAASKEYSRDCEPMNGGYQDAYYLQLISNIRRYKGIPFTRFNEASTIDLKGDLAQWDKVKYVQKKPDSKFIARSAYGGSKTVEYMQAAPTDKVTEIKVAHDGDNLYFYIKGKSSFSDRAEKENWLNIFIGTGDPSLKEWESYDYVVGRAVSKGKISVHKLAKDFKGSESGEGSIVVRDDVILVSVPRSALSSSLSKFYFKVAMGVTNPSDIMDSYKTGSVLPMGRLSYMYNLQSK